MLLLNELQLNILSSNFYFNTSYVVIKRGVTAEDFDEEEDFNTSYVVIKLNYHTDYQFII